ncbi:hypothetical protein NKJ35_30145, partial [Mesorhizobium sp. M0136]|uniref:hypothetical protein n=1 Tax=Mesorhizobium sp. M0136 TaxID=2956890 RepID=UPI0033354D5B
NFERQRRSAKQTQCKPLEPSRMCRKLWFASKSLLLDLCYSPTLTLTTSADTRATVTTAVTVGAFLIFKL